MPFSEKEYLIRLGTHIRKKREHQGLSQADLADRAGITKNFLGRVERAESTVSIISLKKIAIGMELSLHELILD